MKLLATVFVTLLLCACASEPEYETPARQTPETWGGQQQPQPQPQPQRETPSQPAPPPQPAYDIGKIQEILGMRRAVQNLGYAEKSFDGCRFGVRDAGGRCGYSYLSVINFRVICRDTEDTIQEVASGFTPLERNLEWRLAGAQGMTNTDSQGYGQVVMVSVKPTKAERFMLIMGGRSLGVEAGEVKQIIVPNDWCQNYALN